MADALRTEMCPSPASAGPTASGHTYGDPSVCLSVRAWRGKPAHEPLPAICVARVSIGLALFWGLLAPAVTTSRAQAQWQEGFESEQPAWQVPAEVEGYRLVSQARTSALPHAGMRCEQLRWEVGSQPGELWVELPVGEWAVVDELSVGLWIRSNQPAVTLAARVVLPRSLDAATGQAITCLVEGTTYQHVGEWERLLLDNVPNALKRRIRMLRLERRRDFDEHEAYIDRVVLVVRASSGELDVWTDELDLRGPPRPRYGKSAPQADGGPSMARLSIELAGPLLVVEGRPRIPRLIEHRGESPAFLKQLGFDGLWMADPPGDGLLQEAARAGMWVVCPPPDLSAAGERAATAAYSSLLAWEVGSGLLPQDVDTLAQAARLLRRADAPAPRPLVAEPLAGGRELSRHVQILRAQRFPLGSTCELADLATWLHAQFRTGHPATAWWAHVQTTYPPGLRAQMAALDPGSSPPVPDEAQVLLLAYTSLAAGARGLVFQSDARLDGQDPETQARAAGLTLVNWRLELIEPFVIGSRFACLAQADRQEVLAPVLQNDRAWLVLPMLVERGSQCVCGGAAAKGVTLMVPGVPEAYQAYQITPAGVLPLARQRVAGGMRVTLQEFDIAGLVLLTSDTPMVSAVHRRAAAEARRSAPLARSLAEWRLKRTHTIDRRLAAQGRRLQESASRLAEAQRLLEACAAHQRAADWAAAAQAAAGATRELRQLERAHWTASAVERGTPATSAAAATFAGLALLRSVAMRATGAWGPNRLAGVAAVREDEMYAAGWQRYSLALPGVRAEARLAVPSAEGVFPIRLAVERAGLGQAPELVETAPVWVESPPIRVRKGEWVRIRGRVWFEDPVTGSIDGLMIIDSLGGLGMAERITATDDWREFVLYRMALADGELYITFALTGYGVAWLDALAVESLHAEGRTPALPPVDGLPLKADRLEADQRVRRAPERR